MHDLVYIATDLNKALAGLTDEQRMKKFASIGLDMESAQAFNIMSQNVDKLKDSIDFTTNSQGQLNEAVKNAAQPMDSWRTLGNEVKAIMIEIGENGVGWFGQIGQKILDTVNYIKNLYNKSTAFRDIVSLIGSAFQIAFNGATWVIRLTWNVISAVWDVLTRVKTAVFGAGDGFENMYLRVKPYILWMHQYLGGIASIMGNIASFDLEGIKNNIGRITDAKSIQELRQQVLKEAADRKKETADKANPPELTPQGGVNSGPATPSRTNVTGSGSGSSGDAASKVTGMQGQARNITINMDAMFKMGNLVSQNKEVASMSKKELEAWFTEMAIRMIRNLETSYS
jgi:hypothetical protein